MIFFSKGGKGVPDTISSQVFSKEFYSLSISTYSDENCEDDRFIVSVYSQNYVKKLF